MGAWLSAISPRARSALLGAEVVRARGLFRPESVQRLIARPRANRVDGTDRILR